MRWLDQITFRAKSLFRKRRLDTQLSEEIRTHVEMATEANIAAGMSAEEARYAALRVFGGVEQIKERARDERGFIWAHGFVQDARHGFRLMRKHWAYSAFIVAIMALGIGAVTSVYSVINAVVVRPLPVREPGRLVCVSGFIHPMSLYEQLRDNLRSVSDVMAVGYPVTRGLRVEGQPPMEPVATEEVSGNFFTGLGVKAAQGRLLTPTDDQPGNPAMVAVISYGFWQRSFGGAEHVVGSTIYVGDSAITIIGVTPPEFKGVRKGNPASMWLPLQLSARLDGNQPWGTSTGRGWLGLMMRLRAETTLAQAQAELGVLQQHSEQAKSGPQRKPPRASEVLSLEDGSHGFNGMWKLLHKQLLALLGMAGAALLIACANLSSLVLVRSAARTEEVATRMALGASRGRVMRQLATESLLLIVMGGALGALLSGGGAHLLMGYVGSHIDVSPDRAVLGWALVITLGLGSAGSLIPAWLSTDRDLCQGLKTRSGGSTNRRQNMLGRVLVTTQIALSFVLIMAAVLLGQTLRNLQATDLGYNRHGLLTFLLRSEPGVRVARQMENYRRVLDRLQAHPGVEGATFAGSGLFSQIMVVFNFTTKESALRPEDQPKAKIMIVGPGFFKTLGIPLMRGRGFNEQEESLLPAGDGKPNFQSVVISQSFARLYFPEGDPVGRHFTLRGADVEIVGVAGDVIFSDLKETTGVEVYLCYGQNPEAWRYPMLFEVRGTGSVEALARDIRKIVGDIDPTATVDGLMTVDAHLEQLTRREQTNARVSGFIGSFAVLLAGIGLFGVLAYSTRSRTREIGIRMALGASTRDVLWQVIRQALIMVLLGSAAGFAGYLGLVRLLAGMVYGVSLTSPYVLGLAVIMMLMLTVIACWLPARRATKVDPMVALRCE